MLKNISVRAKLFVLLALPLAALIALSGGNALEKYRVMRGMDRAVDVVELAAACSGLIHELQKERGMSAGLVAARGTVHVEEIREQRRITAARRKGAEAGMASFKASCPDAGVNAFFAPLAGKLEALDALQRRIDDYNIAPSEVIAEYTAAVAQLMSILRGVLDECEDAGLYARAVNFLHLISAKEFAGQERATLNVALSSRRFGKLLYRAWIERVTLQREELKAFLEQAGPAGEVYAGLVPPLLQKVESFRQAAFESAGDPRLDGDANAWFAASTAYIDALYEVEAAAGRELERTAHGLRDAARQALYLSLGVTLAVILCTFLLARRIVRSIIAPLRRSLGFAQSVAAGHLDVDLQMVRKDEFGVLGRALHGMLGSIRETLARADDAAEAARREAERAQAFTVEAEEARRLAEERQKNILAAAARISSAVASMSAASQSISSQIGQSDRGAREQSERLGEVAVAMEEMSATVRSVAQSSSAAAETAEGAGRQALKGSEGAAEVARNIAGVLEHAEELKSAMDRLGTRVGDIDKVLNVITDIADQTNLLALNAAIEAARAGDAGRGFAVVADEVRKLAEKTVNATKEVAEVLSGIQGDAAHNIATVEETVAGISETTALTRQSDEVLREIVELSGKTSEQIRAIAAASEQQAAGSEAISKSVEGVNRIAVETVAAMDHSAAAVGELLDQTRSLENLIRELEGEG